MNSSTAMVRARAVETRSPHNRLVAMVLCWFLGWAGAHRFYTGRWITGVLQLLTAGGFGIWFVIDFILLLLGRFHDSEGRVLGPPQLVYDELPAPQQRKQLPSYEPELEPVNEADDVDDEIFRDPLEDEFDNLEAELRRKGEY